MNHHHSRPGRHDTHPDRCCGYRHVEWDKRRPSIERKAKGIPEAWFLGPKGENAELLKGLVQAAIDHHVEFRRHAYPKDPVHITDEIRSSADWRDAAQALKEAAEDLCAQLKQSVPFASLRYQGHMLWDQALPATVGYIASMLYNQNNVAAEASPVTTQLEISVGNDLCEMLGLEPPPHYLATRTDYDPRRDGAGKTYAWGHITADGSIANIEGLWAARNARYLGVALAAAVRAEEALAPARCVRVELPDGRRPLLLDLEPWGVLNLPRDTSLALSSWIMATCRLAGAAFADIMERYAVQHLGLLDFHRRFLPGIAAPIFLAPATAHYSWAKAGTLLGLGSAALKPVPVDGRARMDAAALKAMLADLAKKKVPVIAVVAVIGSTEESAVDPLDQVLRIRRGLRKAEDCLDFAVHADAAWGGYFATMLRGEAPAAANVLDVPTATMSPYVEAQYRALKDADSITVDPHKAGYVPYPAGALCYRNSSSRDLISLRAPVVYHSASEPTVGIYGVEGSKPGAAAAAVWLAHRVIGADRQGYGRILGECLFTSKRVYARLATLHDPRFTLTTLQMLPAERDGRPHDAIESERRWLREVLVDTTNSELRRRLHEDPSMRETFRELGSDQVIVAFALNPSGNRSLDIANAFNDAIFRRCSRMTPEPKHVDLYLTSSSFDPATYGKDFVDRFARRLGVKPEPGKAVEFLITTTMDPWTTEVTQEKGPPIDFLVEIEKALVEAAAGALRDIRHMTTQECM